MWHDAHLSCVCVSVPRRSTSDNISCELQARPSKAFMKLPSFHWKYTNDTHTENPSYSSSYVSLIPYCFFQFQLLFPSVMVVVESIKSQKVRIVYRVSSPGNLSSGCQTEQLMFHMIKRGWIAQLRKITTGFHFTGKLPKIKNKLSKDVGVYITTTTLVEVQTGTRVTHPLSP